MDKPYLSVIIPNYNSAAYLRRCLTALRGETDALGPEGTGEAEVIVVDDASTDDSLAVAREMGARVFQLDVNSGPAAARNHGARQASGEILWFLDSDVEADSGTLALVIEFFRAHPEAAAVVGSYDDEPADPGFCSQWKNLFHHFVHQQAGAKVSSFWSGCGAIRKAAFDAAGGFDEDYWREPMIEDIHLGYALGRQGHEIRVLHELQVKHHKRWTLYSLVKTDLFHRAIPWTTVLLHNRGGGDSELNLKANYKLSVVAVYLAILSVMAGVFRHAHWAPALAPLFLGAAVALNFPLVRFFARKRGVSFAVASLPLLWLYFFYCGVGFLAGSAVYRYEKWTGREIFKKPHAPEADLAEAAKNKPV